MSFIDNLRSVTSLGGPFVKAPQAPKENKQEYTPVYGFEQDKENYVDTSKNKDELTWRFMTALDNDTGKEKAFVVGFTNDGRIGAAGYNKGDGQMQTYRTVDGIADFFKKNFNRDAGNITIFDDANGYADKTFLVYDSESDGSFIPSQALGVHNRGQQLDYDRTNAIDRPTVSMRDAIREARSRQGAKNGYIEVPLNADSFNSAMAGNAVPLQTKFKVNQNEFDNFMRNRNSVKSMLDLWLEENNPQKRHEIVSRYADYYGYRNNPILEDLIMKLDYYDEGEYKGDERGKDMFNREGRQEWYDSFMNSMSEAERVFSPYRQS